MRENRFFKFLDPNIKVWLGIKCIVYTVYVLETTKFPAKSQKINFFLTIYFECNFFFTSFSFMTFKFISFSYAGEEIPLNEHGRVVRYRAVPRKANELCQNPNPRKKKRYVFLESNDNFFLSPPTLTPIEEANEADDPHAQKNEPKVVHEAKNHNEQTEDFFCFFIDDSEPQVEFSIFE